VSDRARTSREHRGSKGVKDDRRSSDARILTGLGKIEVGRLTTNDADQSRGCRRREGPPDDGKPNPYRP
jgi:hypothetical protein